MAMTEKQVLDELLRDTSAMELVLVDVGQLASRFAGCLREAIADAHVRVLSADYGLIKLGVDSANVSLYFFPETLDLTLKVGYLEAEDSLKTIPIEDCTADCVIEAVKRSLSRAVP